MKPPCIEPANRVTRDDLESLLAAIKSDVAHPSAGVFGPDSITWRVNRESALFLAAGRAALLQLAHPWVATAIKQHSSVLNKPIARFHNTFRIVFTTIFGSKDQAFAAARSLHELHTHIRGELSSPIAGYIEGSHYEANFIPALRWVYATLIESAVLAYEVVQPPLTPTEREEYYAESKVFASFFGIPAAALPPDWESFLAYINSMCASNALGVDSSSRAMAQSLLRGAGSWIRLPHWYRALTTEWMPPRFRDEFALSYGNVEQESADRARRWLPRIYLGLPSTIRFVGPYHEACARLLNKNPGPLIRRSNQFWIGEPRMPFAE
jgi:uncharacterized protein (DUF2236 family)